MRWYDDDREWNDVRELNLRYRWQCDGCGHEREDYPGVNEGGSCDFACGGTYRQIGESYDG